ncbi:MAG TPA: PAS domain S-box protein [Vicinamibacterales bacterium]|nr:PAS domain S-box protein [Vicinamibacterales bacterium]
MASATRTGAEDDTNTLRRCVRELAALSSLSAAWSANELPQIADGLAGVLLRILPIDLVHVRLFGIDRNVHAEATWTPGGPVDREHGARISRSLQAACANPDGAAAVIANPVGDGRLMLVSAPLGYGADYGMLIAGSPHPDFPTQADRLILGVACNQAAVALQHHRSAHKIRRSEQELSDFFDNATVGLHWVGPDGTILRANRAELEMLGYAEAEYVGRNIADFHADREVIDDILRCLWNGDRLRNYEARMRCKDGSIRHVLIDSSVLWEGGEFIHTRCFTRDITEQKRAEESRFRLAAIVESSEDAIISEDLRGTIVSWNRGAEVLYGYTAAEVIGKAITMLAPPELGDEFPAILDRLVRGERVEHYETVRVAKDGRRIDVSLTVSPVRDSAGRIQGISKIARDISKAKQAQEALRRQTERLGLLWEAASVLLVAADPEGMLKGLLAQIGPHLEVDTYFHYVVSDAGDTLRLSSCAGIAADATREIARLDFGESICGTVAQQRRPIVAGGIQQSNEAILQRVKSFGMRAFACNPLLVGERLLGTLSFGSRVKDHFDADEIAFIETISHYVTVAFERLRLLDALKEADRRKDEFLATLAHELRNPLAPIRNAVKVLHVKGSQEPEARWGRNVIERQIEHLTRLIDDLLEISRIARNVLELRRRRVELAEVIAGALEGSRPLIDASGHQLTVTLPSEPVYLDGDLVRLSQVFLNLLNNAAKYTEQGGRIWLTAERQHNVVIVRVKDNGVGIAPEKLPRLFEMFFQVDRSLERTQGGLGIGLALARRLIEAHGGSVEARSEGAGKGSEFTVRLPVLADIASAQTTPPPPDRLQSPEPMRVLVVDDNRDATESLAIFLRLTGNEVFVAYDGEEAVDVAERERPDVVLLDIGLPRVNGEEACRRIRAKSWGAGIKLIAVTGWGQADDRNRTAAAGFDAHLVKPIDPSEVVRLVESLRSR